MVISYIQSISYDSNGKILESSSSEFSSWSFVIPETVGEELLEIFCFGKEDAQTFIEANKYYDEAKKLAQSKRFVEAVEFYKKAIAIRPKDWHSHFELSKAFLELKQYQLAIFHANKAIEFADSNYVYIAYHNLGEIYEKQKRFDFAIQAYKKALDLKTDCSFCESNIENLYENHSCPFHFFTMCF